MNNVKNRKSVALILSVVLVLCLAVGGTLAWLVAESNEVKNTFTYGDIDLSLDETLTDEKGQPVDEQGNPIPDGQDPKKTKDGNTYEMLPGEEYLKDPAITVENGNEACWLFVKLTEKCENEAGTPHTQYNFDHYLTYGINTEWNELKTSQHESVYFRYIDADADVTDATGVTYNVLDGDKIVVKEDVTKEMLNALDNNGQAAAADVYAPKLIVKGYAIQYSGFEVDDMTDSAKVKAAAEAAWAAIEAQQ